MDKKKLVKNYKVLLYINILNNKNKSTSVQVTEDIGGISVTYTQCANSWKIIDIANKSVYNELFSTTGSANFFVLDELNELFYLPKTNNIYQPTTDLSKANTYISAGLPNITGSDGVTGRHPTANRDITVGAIRSLSGSSKNAGYTDDSNSYNVSFEFDASLSNPIYGNSDTVQPQANNVFIYYKVGNTINIQAGIDLDAKIDNFVADNNTSWDGQWIEKRVELNSSTAVGEYIIDLSDYLPNDNQVYEVYLYSKIANNSSYSETLVCSDIFTTYMSICGVSDVTVDGTNCFTLPVGKKRIITKKIASGATANFNYLVAVGYRRLGTNI